MVLQQQAKGHSKKRVFLLNKNEASKPTEQQIGDYP